MSLLQYLADQLTARRQQSLYRSRRVVESAQAVEVRCNGTQLINFSSNDYLGLANHPQVIAAFKTATDEYGVGSGAAHLICGHMRPHHRLEEELAEFVGRTRALLFSTGYMANLGVISGLLDRHDEVFQDKLNHASLLDAGQLSRATLTRYRHADPSALNARLAASRARFRMVATDAVFSMDGDLAPLPELVQISAENDATVMVDDAHGFGVLGETGAGTLEYFDLNEQQVPILMATLGKALGTFGAFVAGNDTLIESLIQQSRSYVYTTALPPAVAEATRESLRILKTEPERRARLHELIARFKIGAHQLGLSLMPSDTPIQPLLVGDAQHAVELAEVLRAKNFLLQAIRPPTVPEGGARLRITLSAEHRDEHVDRLLDALGRLPPELTRVNKVSHVNA
jgi:8-amino-7-oxononanoate synthase